MPQEAVSTTETKDAGEGAEDTADGVMAAEERFASIREAQAGGGDDVPASLCPDFDLENPLSYATRKLKRIHAETQRPFDLKQMDAAQRQAERACLKYQLRNYDLAFQNRYGHFVGFALLLYSSLSLPPSSIGLSSHSRPRERSHRRKKRNRYGHSMCGTVL